VAPSTTRGPEAAGAIERVPGRPAASGCFSRRCLRRPRCPCRPRTRTPCACPCWRAGAGTPIGADIRSDDFVLLDRAFFAPAPDYLLKVQGDSMRDDGIFDGDLIGVHRTPTARSGEIVVARIDDEITVKRLKIAKDSIRLLPRNPDYAPIEVRPDQDFAIEGLYCGLVRPSR
jgi:repressor LexA